MLASGILQVLILVLMEDALVQKVIYIKMNFLRGLNPCFNGRCTRTNDVNTEVVVNDEKS